MKLTGFKLATILLALPAMLASARPQPTHNEKGTHMFHQSTYVGTVLNMTCLKPSDHQGMSLNLIDIRTQGGKVYQVRQFGPQPWVVQNGKRTLHHAIKVGDTVRATGHPMGGLLHADTVEILSDAPKAN